MVTSENQDHQCTQEGEHHICSLHTTGGGGEGRNSPKNLFLYLKGWQKHAIEDLIKR